MSEIKLRGKKYYANCSHQGVRLRDCLHTGNLYEAQRALVKLKIEVERKEYQKRKELFDDRFEKYKPISRRGINKGKPSKDKADYAQVLFEQFKGQRITDIDVEAWAREQAEKYTTSTCSKHATVMRELGFEVPSITGQPGKQWTLDHVLEEEEVLKVLELVPEKYRDVCKVSVLTGFRLGNVIEMRKKDVQATGWIKPVKGQAKTGLPIEVKIGKELSKIFSRLPSPLRDDDFYFPHLQGSDATETKKIRRALTKAVWRAFRDKAKLDFGSFTHFRHFHACSALDSGHSIEEIQAQLGHKNISQTQVYARVKREKLAKITESIDTNLTQIGKQKIDAL